MWKPHAEVSDSQSALGPEQRCLLTHDGHTSPLTHSGHTPLLTHSGHTAPLTHDGHTALLTQDGHTAPLTQDGHTAPLTHDGHSAPLTQDGHTAPITHDGHTGWMGSSVDHPTQRPGSPAWLGLVPLQAVILGHWSICCARSSWWSSGHLLSDCGLRGVKAGTVLPSRSPSVCTTPALWPCYVPTKKYARLLCWRANSLLWGAVLIPSIVSICKV